MNPLADIAMQDIGLCILSIAFDNNIKLKDRLTFVELPYDEENNGYDWKNIVSDDYELVQHAVIIPADVITKDGAILPTAEYVTDLLIADSAIIAGTVRLHVSSIESNTRLLGKLMYLRLKNNDNNNEENDDDDREYETED